MNVVPQTRGLARGQSLYMNWKKVPDLQVEQCFGERAGFPPPLASLAGHPCAVSNLHNRMVVTDPAQCARTVTSLAAQQGLWLLRCVAVLESEQGWEKGLELLGRDMDEQE